MTEAAGKVKLTGAQREALRFVAAINSHGLPARCPHADLIRAANECVALGLMTREPHGRYITPAGRALLSEGGV